MTTVPANVFEMPKMVDVLASEGEPIPSHHQCPRCVKLYDAQALYETTSLGEGYEHLPRFICVTCISDPHRQVYAKQYAEQEAAKDPWMQADGMALKAKRNTLVNETLWTTAAGSPLTSECQSQISAWRSEMNKLTIVYATPQEVVMPVFPELVYDQNAKDFPGLSDAPVEA